MRVWLVEGQYDDSRPPLEALLRQLAASPGRQLALLGTGLLAPGHLTELRGWQLDLLVIPEERWPDDSAAQALLDLEVGLVVVVADEHAERFLSLAETYPIGLAAPPSRSEDLWPTLLTTLAARRRQQQWKEQIADLQTRLEDRIVIERAKGILGQRLGITEEEAYKRLRLSSRRQRRPIRDIAQALLDTESLLQPESGGCLEGPAPGLPKILPG